MQKYWWYQTEWHSKIDKSMQVNGMGESTREAFGKERACFLDTQGDWERFVKEVLKSY